MSADSVALEVFSIRLPLGDPELNSRVWTEVDEQHLPAETRRRLSKNGFRAGVIAGQIPPALAKLLDLKDKPGFGNEAQQVRIADLAATPRVTTQHLQTRAGQRSEITASGIFPQMPVLVNESGEIRGLTYEQAQGVFALSVAPQPDGRVQVELLPEIHHGQNRQRWIGDQSMFRLELGRPKRAFDEMKISALLGPGAILVLGSQPNRQGSLGHYFFLEGNEHDDRREQKLILVRLCQTQHDDLISPGPLKLSQ